MLWSMMRLIFKTSGVTPDFFYVFNILLSFSNCSQSFKKSVRGNFWARTSLRIGSCLACVYRVMEVRGKFGEHKRSVRVARGANVICEGLLFIFFLIMMKKWLLLKIYPY